MGTSLAEFDRLVAGRQGGDDPALAEFDKLIGGSSSPGDPGGDIDLREGGDRQPAAKPAAGRAPSSVMSRDLAPIVRKSVRGIGEAISRTLNRNVVTDTRKPQDVRRRTGELAPVTIEADPSRVTVSRTDRVRRDWPAAVKAESQAGFERIAEGGPADTSRAHGPTNYNADALRAEAANARERASKLRMQGTVEAKNAADDLDKRADNTELLVDKIEKTDTKRAIAGRYLSSGFAGGEDMRMIRDLRERDLVLAPEDQEGRVSPLGTEREFSAGKDLLAPLVGIIPPILAGGVMGRALSLGVARLAASRGMPRVARFAEKLGTVYETPAGPRGATGISARIDEFLKVAPQVARREALQGNVLGAGITANVAREAGDPRWKEIGVEDFAMGAVAGGVGGVALSAAGRALGMGYDVVKHMVGGVPRAVPPPAAVAAATQAVDALRPDHTPIGDKMPEAHGRAIADMIERLIGQKKAAMPADERLALAASQRAPAPEGIVVPEVYIGTRESRVPPDVPLRSQRDLILEREGVEPVERVPQTTSAALWEAGREQRAADLNTPEGLNALTRRLSGIQEEPPPEPQSLTDRYDMSKNMERIQAEQRMVEEVRVQAEADARLRAAAEPQQRPRTFTEELQEAGKGDLVQRMKDSDLVAYARRVARHTDKVGRELQRRVYDEIKGRGLDKKVGPAALVLAAATRDDEDEQGALVAAAALSTGRTGKMHEGRYLYSRLERAIEAKPWKGQLPIAEVLNKFKQGPFSQAEVDAVLRIPLSRYDKISHDEVLRLVRENAIEIGDVRATPSGTDITPGREAVEPRTTPRPADWQARRAEEQNLADADNDPEGPFPPDYNPETARVREEYDEEVATAQQTVDDASSQLERARGDAEDAYGTLTGNRPSLLHRALGSAESDGAFDVDDAMNYLQEHSAFDDLNSPKLDGDDMPRDWGLRQHADDGTDEGGAWEVLHNGEVASSWPTEWQAWADMNGRSGADIPSLGNLTKILDDVTVRFDKREGLWEVVRQEFDENDKVIDSEVLATDVDVDTLVQDYVYQAFNADSAPFAAMRGALDEYKSAYANSYDVDSEHYTLLNEGMEEQEYWIDRVRDARAADHAAAQQFQMRFSHLRDFDEEFYQLGEEDQNYIRAGIERGAVGTISPLTGHAPEGGGVSYEYVFDPEQPHTPFPREGVRSPPDPDQFELLSPEEQVKVALTADKAEAVTTPLKATARAKFTTYQRVPGGKNYREVRLQWENNPGDTFTEGHFDEPNNVAHLRMTEHDYAPPTEAMKMRLDRVIARRSELGRQQGEVAQRYNAATEGVGVNYGLAGTTERDRLGQALAREYAAINQLVEAVENEYNDLKRTIVEPGSAGTERTLNAFEHQSDWKQRGEDQGFAQKLTPEREAEVRHRLADVRERHSQVESEMDVLGDRIDETWNAKLERAHKRETKLHHAWNTEENSQRRAQKWDNYTTEHEKRVKLERARAAEREQTFVPLRNERSRLGREIEALQNRLEGEGRVPDMPFKDPDQIFGLTSARMLSEAAAGNYDRVAWSTAENRNQLAHLSLEAGKITYDQSVTGAVKRFLKGLGFKDTPVERIVMDGYDHWSVKLTPEIRAKIRDVGFPILGVLALAGSDDEKTQGAGALVAATFITRGRKWKLVAQGGMHGAIDPNAVTEKILAPAVANRKGEYATGFMHHDAAWSLSNHLGLSKDRGLKAYSNYLHGFVTNRGRFLSKTEAYKFAEKELAKPIKAQIKNRTARGAEPTLTSEDTRGKLYSNPIGPALRELKRSPTAAAVTAVATLAANSGDDDISDTAPPLYALAILSAIGSKNLKAGGGKLGRALVEGMRKTETGTKLVRFTNPDALLTPDVRAAVLAFEALRAKGTARQVEFSKKLRDLGPLGDRIVSDFIEGEQFVDSDLVRALPPEELHNIAIVAQEAADEVEFGTLMKMESGALHPESAIPNYLPGKYAYWEALDAMTERAPRGKGATQKPRLAPVKRRTLARENVEERNRLGEIREASYRVAVAIESAYSQSAAANLFKTLKATPGVIHPEFERALDDFLVAKELMRTAKTANNAADIATAQTMLDAADLTRRNVGDKFKLKGGDYVTLPDTKSMGVLRGMVVQRDVANDLNGIPEKRATDRLMRFWKLSKTVFNPGTHVANVVSNTTVAHMGGMRMTEQPIWLTRAKNDMKNYGAGVRAIVEDGQANVNTATATGEGFTARTAQSEEALRELAETTRPETAKVLRESGIRDPKADPIPTFRAGAQWLRDLYNDEDNIFRVAMYLKARAPERAFSLNEPSGMGMTHEAALAHVKGTFGNFRTRSPLLRVLRGSIAPFILYPAKVLPAFARNVVDHPLRYITLISTWGALNEYAEHEVGEVPERDVDERDRKKYGYFFPGLTQLPFENKRGKAATDLARWTPMSGMTDVAQPGSPQASINPKWPRILQPSGPLADIYGKFVNNIDPFTREPRYKSDYPLKRNIGRGVEDVLQLVLPSALGFHRQRIMRDIENGDMEALRTDLLGPTGLRPRYLRKGGNLMGAESQRKKSMLDARLEALKSLRGARTAERREAIMRDYMEYVEQIDKNFRERAALPPRKK